MNNEKEIALLMIKIENGFKENPFYSSDNFPSIGYGRQIGGKYDSLPDTKTTEKEESKRLNGFVDKIIETMISNPDLYRAYLPCNPQQRAVMISMAHEIKIYGILQQKKLLAALEGADFELAAKEILNSLAARQTPKRWARNAEQMKTGILDDYYL